MHKKQFEGESNGINMYINALERSPLTLLKKGKCKGLVAIGMGTSENASNALTISIN
uniref:Ketoacyl_synth_N domain-containing protein n=1 Tax=Haemonchus contortus TaxID=6289 RepID=A0A7I4YC45_HAECO